MKAHIKRWVNEKHDVLTAEDMKQALESHGGLTGYRAAVVEVDISQDVVKDNKIPGISMLNNFQFIDESDIHSWRAYDIGPSRLLRYSDLQVLAQQNTNLKVIQPFGQLMKGKGVVGESSKKAADMYSCQKSGCVLTFKLQQDAHMDTGKHRRELESESLYDIIPKRWASRVTGVTVVGNRLQTAIRTLNEDFTSLSGSVEDSRTRGWALKNTRKPPRMTEETKTYLVNIFEQASRVR